MRNKKYIRTCKVCFGDGEYTETTWREPGFVEKLCPCCKGTGKASARKCREFEAQCKLDDEAEALMEAQIDVATRELVDEDACKYP